MSLNPIPPSADFRTERWEQKIKGFQEPIPRVNYVFKYTLPDDEGNLIEIKFNKLKICTEDGEEKHMWVLCSAPFTIVDPEEQK